MLSTWAIMKKLSSIIRSSICYNDIIVTVTYE